MRARLRRAAGAGRADHGLAPTGTIKEYCSAGMVLQKGRLMVFEDINDAIEVHRQQMEA